MRMLNQKLFDPTVVHLWTFLLAWKKDATYLTNVNFLCVLHLTMVIMLLKTQAWFLTSITLDANHEIFIFTSKKFQTPLGRNFQI